MTASLPRGARSSYTYRARGVNVTADLTEAEVRALASALQLPLTTADAPEVTHRLNAFIEALASLAAICARRGYKSAIVAVAHRLCRVLYALLRNGTEFQPSRLGIEEGPFTHTVTRRFRLTPKSPGRLALV